MVLLSFLFFEVKIKMFCHKKNLYRVNVALIYLSNTRLSNDCTYTNLND